MGLVFGWVATHWSRCQLGFEIFDNHLGDNLKKGMSMAGRCGPHIQCRMHLCIKAVLKCIKAHWVEYSKSVDILASRHFCSRVISSMQRQGHCSYGSGGIYLSWSVARGQDWPAVALREGRIRSRAVRQAARSKQDPWFSFQGGQQTAAGLHVLRLLFAAACNIDKACFAAAVSNR